MRIVAIATALALGLAAPALAQMKAPGTPAATTDAAGEAKFKTADKNNNGSLDGAELDSYRPVLAQVDADKDGKISRTEFLAGMKAGHIK